MLPEQVSPSVEHVVAGFTQTPPLHTLPQHCTLDVHAAPAMLHSLADEHCAVSGSQNSVQHSLDAAQLTPIDLHSFGPLHRFTPSMSWSQRAEQQSPFSAHVSPVGLHAVAGTSHLPPTQLSEQQSVDAAHFWLNEAHVVQLTPG